MVSKTPVHDLPTGPIDQCQICNSSDLEHVISLGHQAPCDSLLTVEQLRGSENTYPLNLLRCLECGLVQIDYAVRPEELFYPEYPYRSGITETLLNNLQAIARTQIEQWGIPADSLVVDLGSNDGSILQGFKREGLRVLGVEPTNIAKIAEENGIPTIQSFFDRETAARIVSEHGKVSMTTAANMFAHVAKLGELIDGVHDMLTDGGYFLSESHYLLDLLETVQYDSIYHEHLKYYSLKSIIRLLEAHDFTVVDAERIPNYGGSIRVVARKGTGHESTDRLAGLLNAEDEAGLEERATFDQFRDRVLKAKSDLQKLIVELTAKGERVVGVGCPGRSSTLVTYSNLDPTLMPYIAEQSTSLKLGLHLPGKHIPIVDEQRMFDEQPENVLMLSWHYCAPIIKKLRARGLKSKIIIPLPEVHYYEG
jgi:hypothetical protein